MYLIIYDKQAQKDAKNLKAAKLDAKAKELIKTLKENPLKNSPPYEELVGNLAGLYSRRILNTELFIKSSMKKKL